VFATRSKTTGGSATALDMSRWNQIVALEGHQSALTVLIVGGVENIRKFHCDVCGPIEDVLELAKQKLTRDFRPEERERFHIDTDDPEIIGSP
jgi:hypothetical protein